MKIVFWKPLKDQDNVFKWLSHLNEIQFIVKKNHINETVSRVF